MLAKLIIRVPPQDRQSSCTADLRPQIKTLVEAHSLVQEPTPHFYFLASYFRKIDKNSSTNVSYASEVSQFVCKLILGSSAAVFLLKNCLNRCRLEQSWNPKYKQKLCSAKQWFIKEINSLDTNYFLAHNMCTFANMLLLSNNHHFPAKIAETWKIDKWAHFEVFQETKTHAPCSFWWDIQNLSWFCNWTTTAKFWCKLNLQLPDNPDAS